jgi:hypothetical protein
VERNGGKKGENFPAPYAGNESKGSRSFFLTGRMISKSTELSCLYFISVYNFFMLSEDGL